MGVSGPRPRLGRRVTERPELTEKQIEHQIMELFARAGWEPSKTDAGMIQRGDGPKRGHLPKGFPDLIVTRGLPGTVLCLSVLIEVKTVTGKLRPDQEACHAALRARGIQPQVVRDVEDARAYIAEANAVAALLRGRA